MPGRSRVQIGKASGTCQCYDSLRFGHDIAYLVAGASFKVYDASIYYPSMRCETKICVTCSISTYAREALSKWTVLHSRFSYPIRFETNLLDAIPDGFLGPAVMQLMQGNLFNLNSIIKALCRSKVKLPSEFFAPDESLQQPPLWNLILEAHQKITFLLLGPFYYTLEIIWCGKQVNDGCL